MKKTFLVLVILVLAASAVASLSVLRKKAEAPQVVEKPDLIRITNLQSGGLIESPLQLTGEARGYWYFEASFPVKLYDANGGNVPLNPPYIMATADWMTEDFVPFEATLEFVPPATDTGTLVLEKDNPSGLPEYADSLSIPVRFR